MNIIIYILLFFSIVGLIDKLLDNRLHLGQAFDQGMAQIGELLIDVGGIYCVGLTVAEMYGSKLTSLGKVLFFDPAVIIGCLLAPDMGAYPICKTIAENQLIGRYAGIIIGATMGGLVSFYLPVYLSNIRREDKSHMILGFLYGASVLPVTMILAGMLWGISIKDLFRTLSPVLLICLLIFGGLLKAENKTIKVLDIFGKVIRVIVIGSYGLLLLRIYFEGISFISDARLQETLFMVIKMGITISGSLVLVEIIRNIFRKQLTWIAGKLGINEWSLLGILVGIPTGIAILPIYARMDSKGKIINGAFTISGHYMLGGQLALIAANESSKFLSIYICYKFLGGILAILLAYFMENRRIKNE